MTALLTRFLRNRWARRLTVALLLSAVGGSAVASAGLDETQGAASAVWHRALVWAGLESGGGGDTGTTYWCPMHPEIKRKDPNDVCPICNMALVPLEGNGDTGAADGLTLTSRQVQQAGVATAPVLRRVLYREIDTTGRIECDERQLAELTAWVKGKSRIEKLRVNFTGQQVERGEVLAELYSPELITAQEEFVLMLESAARRADTARNRRDASPIGSGALLDGARQKLRRWGLTAEQIDRLAETRRVPESIPIHAPIGGTVTRRHVREGQYVEEGDALFEISDLSRLWLIADIYEEELPLVKIGLPAEVSVPSARGETLQGTVAFIDPVVQMGTRTVRVRIELPNADGRLKPGMFAGVRLRAELPETLAVPESAVLWSGQRRVVLVRGGEGTFEPREVRLGRRWLYPVGGDDARASAGLGFGEDRRRYHEVLAGLGPGEQVVIAGAFLLGAESQFQSVLTKMLPTGEADVSLEEAIGDPLAGRVRDFLDSYYDLSGSLADDDLEAARRHLTAVAESAELLRREAEAAHAAKLADAAGRIARHAGTSAPQDLQAARASFASVSRETVGLLAENGGQTLFGRELFLFRCGMSGVGYENWLWRTREKVNPYMGPKMLECGEELNTLRP